MDSKVNIPTAIFAVILIIAGVCAVYRFAYMHHQPDYSSVRSQLPPDVPGQDKPLPGPPGMHMPGTLKR
jgi:hypothetical protein